MFLYHHRCIYQSYDITSATTTVFPALPPPPPCHPPTIDPFPIASVYIKNPRGLEE